MHLEAELKLQITGIELALCAKQESLLNSEDFEEMCQLIEEISDLGSRLMDHISRLRRDNKFQLPRIH